MRRRSPLSDREELFVRVDIVDGKQERAVTNPWMDFLKLPVVGAIVAAILAYAHYTVESRIEDRRLSESQSLSQLAQMQAFSSKMLEQIGEKDKELYFALGLSAYGEHGIPTLIRLLASTDNNHRRAAANVLYYLILQSPPGVRTSAVDSLKNVVSFEAERKEARTNAAWILSHLRGPLSLDLTDISIASDAECHADICAYLKDIRACASAREASGDACR